MNAFKQIIDFLKPDVAGQTSQNKTAPANLKGSDKANFKEGLETALLEDENPEPESVHGHLTKAHLKKHDLMVSIELPEGALKDKHAQKVDDSDSGKTVLQKLKMAANQEESEESIITDEKRVDVSTLKQPDSSSESEDNKASESDNEDKFAVPLKAVGNQILDKGEAVNEKSTLQKAGSEKVTKQDTKVTEEKADQQSKETKADQKVTATAKLTNEMMTGSDKSEKSQKAQNPEIIKAAKKLRENEDSVEIRGKSSSDKSDEKSLTQKFAGERITDNGQNKKTKETVAASSADAKIMVSENSSDQSETELTKEATARAEKNEANTEPRILNNTNTVGLRREVSGRLAGILQRQSAGNASGSWQHHRFSLEDGKSLNVSMKQTEGKVKLQLGAGNAELQKLLQTNISEIRAHLQQQFDFEIELELRQDTDNGKNQEFAENLKKNDISSAGSVSKEQETDTNTDDNSRPRIFGFNKNEWTG